MEPFPRKPSLPLTYALRDLLRRSRTRRKRTQPSKPLGITWILPKSGPAAAESGLAGDFIMRPEPGPGAAYRPRAASPYHMHPDLKQGFALADRIQIGGINQNRSKNGADFKKYFSKCQNII